MRLPQFYGLRSPLGIPILILTQSGGFLRVINLLLVEAFVAEALRIISPLIVATFKNGSSFDILIVAGATHAPRVMLLSFMRTIVVSPSLYLLLS